MRLVWEWANVDGEDKPNTYCDVLLPKLDRVKDGVFLLTNHVIRLPKGIELKPE